MGFFGFGKKKKDVLDLTENYKRKIRQAEQSRQAGRSDAFSFFDSPATDSSPGDVVDLGSMEEKKKRLARRIAEMTEKMEDLSNQIYHLQQRLEVLERKSDLKRP